MKLKFKEYFLERAFHGSPHKIRGNFTLSKVGSGEGAQMYGWGLYFAENEEVAKNYISAGPNSILLDGKPLGKYKSFLKIPEDVYEREEFLTYINFYLNLKEPITPEEVKKKVYWEISKNVKFNKREKMGDNTWWVLFKLIRDVRKIEKKVGNMYEVEINCDRSELLDWDKVVGFNLDEKYISSIFSDPVMKLHSSLYNADDFKFSYFTGKFFYEMLRDQVFNRSAKDTSLFLLSKGIKGIKYLDAGSRTNVNKTYNYVLFDDSIIKILKMY